MALISCPECGKKVSSMALSCPECGCPISAQPAPVVQQSIEADIEKLTVLARRARQGSDNSTAKKYYDQILLRDPGNWEAIFYSVYFDAAQCKIMNIASAANAVAGCVSSTLAAIGDLESKEQQDQALNDVMTSAVAIAAMFVNGAVNHYNEHFNATGTFQECVNRVVAASNIFSEMERGLKTVFPQKQQQRAKLQKAFLAFLNENGKWFDQSKLNQVTKRLSDESAQADPAYDLQRKINEKKSKIAEKNNQIYRYPTKREMRAPISALITLWLLGPLFLILGYNLYVEEDSLFLLILGVIFLCIALFGCTKTPSRAVCAANARRVQQLKQEINKLQEEVRALQGGSASESSQSVQIKLYDTSYDTGIACYATMQFTLTDAESGKVLATGTQNQILTLKLAGPTVINCHVGRGFKDAVLFYGGEENAKYKLIPNSRTGLRIEATPYF